MDPEVRNILSDVEQRAKVFSDNNDEEGAKAFLASLREQDEKDDRASKASACIRAWFLDDKPVFASKVLKKTEFSDYVRYEAFKSAEHIVTHCPTLFLYLSHPGHIQTSGEVVGVLGPRYWFRNLNEHCSQEQKEQALLGEGSHKVLAAVVNHIGRQKDPQFWIHLDYEWFGEPGSKVREKAMAFGWTPELYVTRLAKQELHLHKFASWEQATPYPYSLFVLQMYLNKDRYGDAFERIFEKLEENPNANPIDAALACILQKQAPQYTPYWPSWKIDYPFEPHPKVQAISDEQKKYLTGWVDANMALGSLQSLVDMLVNGQLTQMLSMRTDETFDLPTLGGF